MSAPDGYLQQPLPHEQDRLRQLTRMRRIATGLLVAMAVIFVIARILQPAHPWLSFVGAFAEAAMVGAIADWFAVTALFRHPMGLPIPHTAIIPKNKDRIGESVGQFLEHNFMTQEVLQAELAQVDFAGSAAGWLAREENSRAIALQLVGAVPALLRAIEDEDAGKFLRATLSAGIRDVKLAPLLGQVLSVLVQGRQHFLLLEKILEVVGRALEDNRPYIRQKVHDNSPRWVPKMVDEKFFERLMDGVQGILAEIQGEDSEWRDRFQLAIEGLIDNLATSEAYEARLHGLLADGLAHPLFRSYAGQVWQDVRQRLLADATSPESRLAARLEGALRLFSRALLEDTVVQGKLNAWIRSFAAGAIVERRHLIADVVKRVIRSWDADTVTRKFELHVGKDLQYIRINGTVVGGLVGLVLHVISLAL
jgi:uncharacterized membrane-anchored protein YjiN (DUF445 family)